MQVQNRLSVAGEQLCPGGSKKGEAQESAVCPVSSQSHYHYVNRGTVRSSGVVIIPGAIVL